MSEQKGGFLCREGFFSWGLVDETGGLGGG